MKRVSQYDVQLYKVVRFFNEEKRTTFLRDVLLYSIVFIIRVLNDTR